MEICPYRLVGPGEYDPVHHFYPRVPNAQLHPLVRYFLNLGNARIAERYCHLHPEVKPDAVHQAFAAQPNHFRWSGADLFHVTDDRGRRRFVVIETNSSPSGQKSMPMLDLYKEQGGYRTLLENTFLPLLRLRGLPAGELAVLWDKNWMEVSGYAAVLADLTGERVHLVQVADGSEPALRSEQGVLHARTDGGWVPLRAAFRYVTQRPWNRIPVETRTALLNPLVACLAGGRNKSVASVAYALYNTELTGTGLYLRTPETFGDVSLEQIPLLVDRLGGVAMVKVPYANAGQGVVPLISRAGTQAFVERDHHYQRFLVQGLIGHVGWSSLTREGRLYHVGTVPSARGELYVADLRFMVGVGPDGFYPLALYSRRARKPLKPTLDGDERDAWEMLGTNLSVPSPDGGFALESERLMLVDSRDFNHLGVGLDDLVEAYVQTVLATLAIDRMADRLITQKGRFRTKLFASLNDDAVLLSEIVA